MTRLEDQEKLLKYKSPPAGLVKASCLTGFSDVVVGCGGNAEHILRSVGLPPKALDTPDSLIRLEHYSQLLAAAAQQTGREDFGFKLGEAFDIRNLGPIGYLFRYAISWGDGLSNFCRYFSNIQDETAIGLEVQNAVARLTYDANFICDAGRKQDALFTLSLIHYAMTLNSENFAPKQIDFQFDLHTADCDNIFFAEFRPRQPVNAIYFASSWLETKPVFSDKFMYELVMRELKTEAIALEERAALLHATKSYVSEMALHGSARSATAQALSKSLGLSKRTLHRRLFDYGTNFRNLKNSVLSSVAVDLLIDTRASITEIAYQLGYSQSSAFSRAFKAETGLSPQEVRKSGKRP